MDFLETWLEVTKTPSAPEKLRLWVGLSIIASLANKNVWTSIEEGKALFPNLFALLVAPSAGGKSMAIEQGRNFLSLYPHVRLAAQSMTEQCFLKRLAEKESIESCMLAESQNHYDNFSSYHLEDGEPRVANSMTIMVSEFGTFYSEPTPKGIQTLAELFDSGSFTSETIGRGRDRIDDAYLNICAGCTPSWFQTGFTKAMMNQGLPARINYIYYEPPEGQEIPRLSFAPVKPKDKSSIFTPLREMADDICRADGFMHWDDEAGDALNDWILSGMKPVPTWIALDGYQARRKLHVTKLILLCALSAHPWELVVRKKDVKRGIRIFIASEEGVGKALVHMSGNKFHADIREFHKWMTGKGTFIPEALARRKLNTMVDTNFVSIILEQSITSGMVSAQGTAPARILSPRIIPEEEDL